MTDPHGLRPREEAQSIERCRGGDHQAFGALVVAYQDRVFNLCFQMCGNRSDAEELTQEAFMKALKSIASFDGRAGFYTWVYRIAANLAISHRRKTGRRSMSLDAADEKGRSRVDVLPGRESLPEQRMEDAERAGQIRAALSALEDEQRMIIILRDMESLDYNQIAEVLGVPTGTVKSRLHRARSALRELLSPQFEKGPSTP